MQSSRPRISRELDPHRTSSLNLSYVIDLPEMLPIFITVLLHSQIGLTIWIRFIFFSPYFLPQKSLFLFLSVT